MSDEKKKSPGAAQPMASAADKASRVPRSASVRFTETILTGSFGWLNVRKSRDNRDVIVRTRGSVAHLGRDAGISIAVAANPGTKFEHL